MRSRMHCLMWHWLSFCLAAVAGCGAGDPMSGVEYRPPADLERLQHRAEQVPIGGLVRDFAASGDALYLLARTDAVTRLTRTPSGWRVSGHIGRAGGGPGEFLNASGLSVTGSGDIVVIEGGRLQRLSSDGTPLGSYTLNLPCSMMVPSVAAVEGGLLVHGNCVARGTVTDTVKAVLAWSADSVTYRVVMDEVRFTRDGTRGTMFASARAFTPGRDGTHLFGTGVSNCVTNVVLDAAAETSTERRCGLVPALYSAPPPRELERRLSMRTAPGAASWPDPLPVYFDRIRVGEETILVRPFAADSVVLERAGAAGAAIAVAPLDGFVGCKAEGCLWVFEDTEPMTMAFVGAAELQALMEARQ